jgi:hypothetical protein
MVGPSQEKITGRTATRTGTSEVLSYTTQRTSIRTHLKLLNFMIPLNLFFLLLQVYIQHQPLPCYAQDVSPVRTLYQYACSVSSSM